MQKSEETPFEAYIQTVLARLTRLTSEQRAVIQAELEAHLVDAAHERGCRPADPTFQAEVIAKLGPARRLGRVWARAYPLPEGTMYGSQKVVFWVLWVVASIVGWFHSSYDDTSLWQFPVGAMVVIALQSLLLRTVAGFPWWRQWLIASIVPWLLLTGLWLRVPWAALPESQGERLFFFSLLLVTVASGVAQWIALRRHIDLAGLWSMVPLMSLVVAGMLSLSLNVAMIESPQMVVWLGGWQEAHILVGMVFGAAYGAVTATILLMLMNVRLYHPSQQQA